MSWRVMDIIHVHIYDEGERNIKEVEIKSYRVFFIGRKRK